MVMDEAEEPRETFILDRGDYLQPGEKVTPARRRAAVRPPPTHRESPRARRSGS